MIFSLFACNTETNQSIIDRNLQSGVFKKDTLLNLYKVSLIIPKGWRFANDDTLWKTATYTFRIRLHNRSGRLVHIEHGLQTIGNIIQPNVLPAWLRPSYIKSQEDTSQILFSDDSKLSEIRKDLPYEFFFESISGCNAMLFLPKNGSGYSGVYFDNAPVSNFEGAEFLLYAENLSDLENDELIRIIRTIVLKPY